MGANWDARYRESPGPSEPAELLTSFADLLPTKGRALDIACGNGRNSIWLAQHGLEVVAVDTSAEALRLGREVARRHGCNVTWIHDDVETFPFQPAVYEVIVCFNYRSPALYPKILSALRPGGWLVYETYTLAQLQFASGPRNPQHLLRPGELFNAFDGMRLAYYRESENVRAVASLVAQKEQ